VIATILAAGVVYLSAAMTPPVYLSESVLEMSSTETTPDKEAVLAQSYVDYFNQPATQEVLRKQAGLSGPGTFTARVVGVSPIIYVDATADQPQTAENAVAGITTAFRTSIEQSLKPPPSPDSPSSSTSASTTVSTLRPADSAVRVPTNDGRSVGNAAAVAALLSVLVVCCVPDLRVRGRTL
jgi:hypothetical protein